MKKGKAMNTEMKAAWRKLVGTALLWVALAAERKAQWSRASGSSPLPPVSRYSPTA